jgi:hypothetical protein
VGKWLAVVSVLLAGCLERAAEICADGLICPLGTVCVDSVVRCALPEQIAACASATDGNACTFRGAEGLCSGGACIPLGCGDGIANTGEQCDTDDLRGVTSCSALGYYGDGILGCNADCTYDTSQCTGGICGDLTVNGPEVCESTVTEPADCRDFGFYDAGVAACNSECRFDVAGCTGFCGDKILNGRESCETGVSLLESCVTYGYNYGWTECRACVPYIDDCHRFGWQAPAVEATGTVRAIHGTDKTDVWVAGDAGLLMHSAGTRFVVETPAVSGDFSALWSMATDDVHLASKGGVVQRWDGSTWTVTFTDPTWSFDALWSAGPGHLLLAGNQGLLSWNGTSWTAVAKPPGSAAPVKLWGAAADDFYVIDSAQALFHLSGGTWASVPFSGTTVVAIGGRTKNDVYVALANRTALRWDGASWSSTPIFTFSLQPRVITGDPSGVFWVGDSNLTFHYDGTMFWSSFSVPTSGLGDLVAAFSPAPGQLYAGGANGLFAYDGTSQFIEPYVDAISSPVTGNWFPDQANGFAAAGSIYRFNGAQWRLSQSNTGSRAVWGASMNAAYAVGDAGAIWKFGGTTWTKMSEPASTPNLYGVHGTAADDVWAVGAGGAIVHYNGSQWSAVTSNTTMDLLAVAAVSPTDAVAVGGNGTIVRWNGTAWSVVAPVTTKHLRDVFGFATNDIIAVGDSGTVLRWNGTSWASVSSGTSLALRSVWAKAPDDIFVVGDLTSVFHFDGYGFTPVKMIAASQYPWWSVWGFGKEVHLGGQSSQSGMLISRTSDWKRRIPPM